MSDSSDDFRETDADLYERFSPCRKAIIVAILSFCAALSPMSSTSMLPAVPEVAATYNTTGSVINASNAVYLVFMGLAGPFWGPFSQIWGRRPICLVTAFLFFAFSVGTALAPNLPAYYVFRLLTAFQGTSFLVVGSSAVSDIYEPRARATALGWFLSGNMIGPAFGPFIGGVIATFCSWRAIFWLQSAMGGVGTLMVFFLLPETYPHPTKGDLIGQTPTQKAKLLWNKVNPFRVAGLLLSYPNLLFAALATSALVWNQYSLLTPIRYVLNPRFGLTTPLQSGLLYIAPGGGYLIGTLLGGRWADYIVRSWIRKRCGIRVPEDRLKSSLPFLLVVLPACMLVYGWTVQESSGGMAVPIIVMVLQGIAQLFAIPSLNTYCLDVMQPKGRSAEAVAGNYMLRYVFAAVGSGVVLPAVQTMGVGWFSTISASFLFASGLGVWATSTVGIRWRERIDGSS